MRGSRPLVAGVVALMFVAGCGEDRAAPDGSPDAQGSAASSPFVVGTVPTGFTAVRVGTGTATQPWGDDSVGTIEPYVVLAPVGADATIDNAIVVSVTGFEGAQGGLEQAAGRPPTTALEVDGAAAFYSTPQPPANGLPGVSTSQLIAVRGEDLAVRVTAPGPDWNVDQLAGIIRATTPDRDRYRSPEVDPPDGWTVVGSADAGFVASVLTYGVYVGTDDVPGPPAGHGAAWMRGEDEIITLVTLPGDELDLGAAVGLGRLGAYDPWTFRPVEVGGRPALAAELTPIGCGPSCPGGPQSRLVVAPTPWGDVAVAASHGFTAPGVDELVALVASMQHADNREWARFQEAAAGGPGLSPEPGTVELLRGRAGEVDWLLQGVPAERRRSSGSGAMSGTVADDCLRLSTGKRACVASASLSSPTEISYSWPHPGAELGAPDLPGFIIVTTEAPGATTMVVSAAGEESTASFVDVPGQPGRRVAIAFVSTPGLPTCRAPDAPGMPPTDLDLMRVELLDASGAALPCAGIP